MEAEALVRLVPIEIRRDSLREHPAVVAWSHLRPSRVEPERLDVLRERRSTGIYRLHGVGAGRSPVIAKRSRSASAAIERRVYEEALPHVPVTAPYYYGSIVDDEAFGWLFLEDVGQERYSTLNEEHRTLVGRWLGRLHSFAARGGLAACLQQGLPDGGPGRYLQHLRTARRDILGNLSNPGLSAEDVAVLRAIAVLQDRLEAEWSRIEDWCQALPPTLVHGDFRPKNGYLRSTVRGGLELLPIDWEMAGWGVPANDLPRLDLASYKSAVREDWPGVNAGSLERLARVGEVFRILAAIGWQSPQLKHTTRQFLAKPMTDLRLFLRELSRGIQAAGLA